MKTKQEIANEIAALKAIKPKCRRYSAFGDDNWKAIDIQILVLEQGWDGEEISARYEDSDDYTAAFEAVQWRQGEADEGLAESCQSLVKE